MGMDKSIPYRADLVSCLVLRVLGITKGEAKSMDRCSYCDDTGRKTCYQCGGAGKFTCQCGGRGDLCANCRGYGDILCPVCDGSGDLPCERC